MFELIDLEKEFYIACQRGCYITVEACLELEIDINAWGGFAIAHAAENGHLDVCKLLISKGANIHSVNYIAIQMAKLNKHNKVVEYLKSLT